MRRRTLSSRSFFALQLIGQRVGDRLANHFPFLQQHDRLGAGHRLQKVARELRHALARDFVHA